MELKLTLLSIASLFLVSCGNDDDFDSRVVNSSLSERTIQIGEGSVLTLGLEFERSSLLPFDGADDVSLVVKLPEEVRYREGTAEIQRTVDDKGVNPTILNCDGSGEQYLSFRLDGDDLSQGRDPSGSADVEIRLTIDARLSGIGIIEAKADKETPLFACDQSFATDVEESIEVVE